MSPRLDVTHKYPAGAWAASTRRWPSLSASALSGFQIRICYQRRRRRSQAGPQRPAPSLPAARSAHRRPAAELAVSRPRGPRRRGAPAPPPPLLQAALGCSARLRLYSQAGAARAAGGGGPHGAGATGGARGGGPHPFPGGAGALRGAGTREKRAVGEGARGCGERELCTRRSSVHLARPPLPPEPGPGMWGAGRGTGCGAAGEWGADRPPQPGEVLEVRGMGNNPAIRPYSRLAFLLVPPPPTRPNRRPGFGVSPRPHLWPGPRLFSPQGQSCPPPPQTGFSALLGSVGTSSFDSPVQFIFLGLYFAGRARKEVAFFLSPALARARFPAPRRAWVPPLAGSGAGCTRVAVHAVGVHRFPAPARAACAPPPARSVP